MAPEPSFLSSLPESRLKAVLQANAFCIALLSTYCMVFNEQVANLLSLPSKMYGLGIGFALCLPSAFLFRLAVRHVVSSRFVIPVVVANVFSAITIPALVFFKVLNLSGVAVILVLALAALLGAFGFAQAVLMSKSSHTYQQTEVIAV